MIAWLVLGTVVLLAIARDMIGLGYERWRLVHGVGAAVVAVFGLHHTLEAGVYSGQGLLAAFWVLAVAAALFTLVHAYWLVPRRQARAAWRIKAVEQSGPGYWDVTVEPEADSQARQFRFHAGQFAWLKVAGHPYTLKEHPSPLPPARRPCPRWCSPSRRPAISPTPWGTAARSTRLPGRATRPLRAG